MKTIKKKNPQNLTEPEKHYALAVYKGTTDIDAFSKRITRESKVSPTDTYAVLIAFVDTITTELSGGRMVHLGKFGSFAVNLKSDGAETDEKFTSSEVKFKKAVN